MCHRFLSLLCLIVTGPAIAVGTLNLPEAWTDSHYGECYNEVADGMAKIYGNDYLSDDNIFRNDVNLGGSEMVLAGDRTSGTNISRTVFESARRECGALC